MIADAWLSCLRTLIADESQRRTVGQSARCRYLERFSLEAMARGTVDVYRKVIEQRRIGF